MSSVLSDHLQANAQNMVGDMTGAVNVARRELAKVDWSTRQPNIVADDWRIYTHRALGYGAVMVDAAAKRIVVSQATLDTLMYASSAMAAFLVDMTRGASGMKFVMFDAGAYADAAKAERDAKGSNVMQTKDPDHGPGGAGASTTGSVRLGQRQRGGPDRGSDGQLLP
jgi:hypothetical protein